MSFSGSPVTMHRPVTTQTTGALNLRTSTPKVVFPPTARHMTQQKCCDTGRPVMIDPMTGGTICSCQLKSGLPTYLSRVPTLPETVYGAHAPGNQFPTNVLMGHDSSSSFYQMNMKSERAADGMKTAPPGVHSPFYLEHLMAAHPYTPFYPGFDLNSARRKNATRETTSALKAWLYEHRKNPYPTKGEKIMLAIITRMTLTQVSTWFANARRRLKKESKMDDKDIDLSDIEVDGQSERGNGDIRLSLSEDDETHNLTADLSDISDAEESGSTSKNVQSSPCANRLFSPDRRSETALEHHTSETTEESSPSDNIILGERCRVKSSTSSKELKDVSRDHANSKPTNQSPPQSKPKIWSISEIISSENKTENKS